MIAIFLRHAERLQSGNDPGLSAAGKRRASVLATMFAGANVTAIFTSAARRTKETAAPLAQKTGLTPRALGDDIAAAKTEILAGGACVLVVGHTNTVPRFVQALGGPSNIEIGDEEFDRLFVLSVAPPAAPPLLQMRYIAP
jgi:broad specificity phosphatase PhoE